MAALLTAWFTEPHCCVHVGGCCHSSAQPTIPGTICSEARYVSEMVAPPGFISGPKCWSIDTKEYADALTAAR